MRGVALVMGSGILGLVMIVLGSLAWGDHRRKRVESKEKRLLTRAMSDITSVLGSDYVEMPSTLRTKLTETQKEYDKTL